MTHQNLVIIPMIVISTLFISRLLITEFTTTKIDIEKKPFLDTDQNTDKFQHSEPFVNTPSKTLFVTPLEKALEKESLTDNHSLNSTSGKNKILSLKQQEQIWRDTLDSEFNAENIEDYVWSIDTENDLTELFNNSVYYQPKYSIESLDFM